MPSTATKSKTTIFRIKITLSFERYSQASSINAKYIVTVISLGEIDFVTGRHTHRKAQILMFPNSIPGA